MEIEQEMVKIDQKEQLRRMKKDMDKLIIWCAFLTLGFAYLLII